MTGRMKQRERERERNEDREGDREKERQTERGREREVAKKREPRERGRRRRCVSSQGAAAASLDVTARKLVKQRQGAEERAHVSVHCGRHEAETCSTSPDSVD